MPTLRPYRDYDEKDVINAFATTGVTLPFNKGTIVTISRGFRNDVEPLEMLGSYGDFSVSNVVSQRYGVYPLVTTAQTGDNPLGLTLFDVRETDENGELLKYRPRKAAEMEACLSGQAVPIVTRGTFQYSGVVGTVTAGAPAYLGANGTVVTGNGTLTGSTPYLTKVGKFLGPTGVDGSCFILFNFA